MVRVGETRGRWRHGGEKGMVHLSEEKKGETKILTTQRKQK